MNNKKYEYLLEKNIGMSKLQELGQDGWQLAAVEHIVGGSDWFYFMREIEFTTVTNKGNTFKYYGTYEDAMKE